MIALLLGLASAATWPTDPDAHLLEWTRIDTGVEKPLIVSEFGAGALAGHHADPDELAVFSEEHQALV